MNKRYGVWSQPTDGSENGKWDISNHDQGLCETMVSRWNVSYPLLKHEVREYVKEQ